MSALFLDSPQELSKRIDRLLQHLKFAAELHRLQRPGRTAVLPDLIWLLFVDAMETSHSIRNAEQSRLSSLHSRFPRSRVDELETFVQRLSRLQEGLPEFEATQTRVAASEAAIERMVDVLDLMRFVRAGRAGADPVRLKRVVLARASGLSLEQCARIWDRNRLSEFDRRSFHDIKTRVIGQIIKGMADEFGLVRTGNVVERRSAGAR